MSTPGEIEISIDRLEGTLPQRIRLSGLSVRDNAGRWLSAAAIEVDWRPLALFSGTLDLADVRVTDLKVDRPPDTGARSVEDGPLRIPSLPVRIAVDRFSVTDVAFGAAVLGEPAVFRLTGEAATGEADTLTSSLVVERTDGVAGRAEASAVYAPHADRLTLDIAVDEPAGGLIARALDLPALPAVAARVSGDGTLTDWRGDASASVGDLGAIEAAVTLTRRDGIRFGIAGTARSAQPTKQFPERLVAGDLAFNVQGRWAGDRILTVERARLAGPALQLDMDGRLALADLTIDARVTARISDPTVADFLAPGATAEGIEIAAEATGPLLQPGLSATASLQKLTAPGIDARRATARLGFTLDRPLDRGPATGTLRAQGEIEDLAADDLADLDPVLGHRFAWRLAGALDLDRGVLDAGEVFVRAGAAEMAGAGTFGVADGTADADLQVTLSDLTGLSPLLDIGVQGRGDLAAHVRVTGFGERLTAKLNGTLRGVRIDDALVHALGGGDSVVAADMTLSPDGTLTFTDVTVDSPTARLTGDATLSNHYERIEAAYGVAITDASVLSGPLGIDLAGRGDIRGRMHGPVRNPGLTGQLVLTDARIEDFPMGRIDGAFSAEDLATLPRGHMALRAAPATGPVDAEADYVFADPEVRLTNLRLRSLGATADGTLAVPTDGAPVRGSLRIAADSLAPWLALAGLDGDGGAAGDLRLSGDGSRQGADLTGTLTNVSWRSGGEPVLRAARAAVTVRATDPLGRPAGRAAVEAAAVTAGELRLDTLSLGAEGDGSDAALRLKATGAFRGALALDAAGRLRIGENRLSLEVRTVDGHAFGQSLTLRAPATLTQQPGAVALSRLDLDFGAARIGAQADVDADRVVGELTVAGLPVASLSPLWPVAGMTGTIGGTVTLDGPRANPTGNAHLTGTGLMIDAAGAAPPLGLDVTGTWLNRRLVLTGRLTGTPERDAELDAEVPLVLDADRLAFSVPGGEPVSARVSWRGDMASLWPLLPLDAHRMTGAAEIAAELAGSLAAPEVSGSLRLKGGEYESFEAGTLIEDIDLALDVADNRAVLSRLTGTDGAKGQLTATGEIAIAPEQGYPFKLNAELSAFALVRRDDVTAVADGRLSFVGTPEHSTLAGQFTTGSVEARIIDRLPAEVASLDVVETDSSEKAAAFRENTKKNGSGPNIALDVAVAMPRQVFVRGRGLESEWAGDLKVTGTAREPIIKGELTVVRGYLSVLTKTFRLTGGSVRFPGGRDAAPELDVRAEHKARNLTVTAQVSGPATNPSIALSSSPALPQDEIVARVLFDRSTAQLGALEAAQLAAAVSELTGAGGGLGPLDFARSLLGVDVLRIETAEPGTAGGPEVEAGKYVRDDVYVGVKKGVADDAGAVGVEIELTPNISVESETGTTGESDLGIKFKWDY